MLRFLIHPDRRRVLCGAALAVLFLCVLAVLMLHVDPAFAQQEQLDIIGEETGLSNVPIGVIIARIIRIFLSILGVLTVVLIIYAGFLWMTAGGDADKVAKAKRIIQQTVIGLIIILSSYAITTFILNALLQATGQGGGVTSITARYSEPLSGSLGAGIIQDHYPARGAFGIPRNTLIFVTFKEPINPASIIVGGGESGELNAENVVIYETLDVDEKTRLPNNPLATTDVIVGLDNLNDPKTFVFDPVGLLGDGIDPKNYTVILNSNIEKCVGTDPNPCNKLEAAFTGRNSGGYSWNFTVSTEVDLTPPTVRSIIPSPSSIPYARNISVELTFSEAMNPIAVTGIYNEADSEFFTNLNVVDEEGATVEGTWEISNGYKTVDFTPNNPCGEDPCGNTIYCLPGLTSGLTLTTTAVAASVGAEPPQSIPIGVVFDGVVDAAANSLDGDKDGIAQGSDSDASETPDVNDNYEWSFKTNNNINDEVPKIIEITPGVREPLVNPEANVEITFSIPMKASTITSKNIQMWPDPWYEFWFLVLNESLNAGMQEVTGDPGTLDGTTEHTKAIIDHPELVNDLDGGWDYFPLASNDVKSSYQICMFPGLGPTSGQDLTGGTCEVTTDKPYCCDGSAVGPPGCEAPKATDEAADAGDPPIYLPDTSE